ncbi:Homeobox protein CDX-1 [Nibea albiflora]|uniref:Homeobox protein CDX-1 n=1 Tax=Nibea albiflora TaxID=240163 RepID=A0ACB7EQM2_NIBAL|nr:Homeobox protein CDX-1 [Nibea albiflora]
MNSQYIPPPYDFTGYHHVPGVGDPSTNAWNSIYTPREEYPYSFPGSSPSAGQVSFSPAELSGTPTAAGGGSFTPYNFMNGQDLLNSRRRQHEPIRPTIQVKIWFQNRRAKERKINRKKLQHSQQASTTTPNPPTLGGPSDAHIATSPGSNILSDTISEEY